MNDRKISLIMMDIDGTIIDSPRYSTVPESLCTAVRDVVNRNILVGLASGRNYGHVMSQMRGLGFTGPYICNGGALVVINDKICSEELLDQKVIAEAWKQARELQCYIEFQGRNVMHVGIMEKYTGPVFPKVGTGDYLNYIDPLTANFEQIKKDHISKITIAVDEKEKAEEIEQFWIHGPLKTRVSLTKSFWYSLELTAPSISKGKALLQLAKQIGIPMAEIVAIGDGDNDVDMLQAAGISFAMANGSKKALCAAKYRAPAVYENGVEQVLRRYILGKENLF